MVRRAFKPEQIINKLREAEVLIHTVFSHPRSLYHSVATALFTIRDALRAKSKPLNHRLGIGGHPPVKSRHRTI